MALDSLVYQKLYQEGWEEQHSWSIVKLPLCKLLTLQILQQSKDLHIKQLTIFRAALQTSPTRVHCPLRLTPAVPVLFAENNQIAALAGLALSQFNIFKDSGSITVLRSLKGGTRRHFAKNGETDQFND